MPTRPSFRAVLILILLAGTGIMLVHYGYTVDSALPYPSPDTLAEDYEGHVGEEFYTWATVVQTGEGGFVAKQGEFYFRVSPTEVAPPEGSVVQVYGHLAQGKRVIPTQVVVSDSAGRRYMFGVSGLAVLVTIAVLYRRTTVDREGLTLRGEQID